MSLLLLTLLLVVGCGSSSLHTTCDPKLSASNFLQYSPPPPPPQLYKYLHRHTFTFVMLIIPQQSSMYCLRSISTYSKMRVREREVWMMSCSVTMLACLRSFRREISRMAVQGAPSSCSSLISFRATNLPVILWINTINSEYGYRNPIIVYYTVAGIMHQPAAAFVYCCICSLNWREISY